MVREEILLRKNRALRGEHAHHSMRIDGRLDFDTVLQGVVDSARALTGSRYDGMAVFEDSGELQSFVTSGFDAEEREQFLSLPEGQALFRHLMQLSVPFRVRDFQSHLRSLGFVGVRFAMRVGEVFSFWRRPSFAGARASATSTWPSKRVSSAVGRS